ncbi:nicotinate (nicotinamide) nucleotide adenylyltransferase [Gemella sp. GH3]|uniref:nicotinate-nucleotide adenylyltransferase n=1 Tax=unclassified Gemella TaxID=2624949 RepID=UPI0015D008EB|nr:MULTISPECIES: nicotinate-nucleotide adenylyltransferase [unclassified Gemella]MBF0714124.1 nicotinate (nicotinamide) nucleotide adenylyltransferase [Gemella sp. GH3.1]NYS51076.1 nicotinate (nicotinamide) nucleotide adenylyltransferase [Gemella sp. GH3]
MEKIVLYGGTFDPIHIGHLITATNALESLQANKVIFIPSNITPLKNNKVIASNKDRYNMIEVSIKSNNNFEVSDYEITNSGTSYTYNTVNYFKKLYPNSKIYFIIGTDRVIDLQQWYKINDLARLVTFVFVARDNQIIEDIVEKNKFYNSIEYIILKNPIIDLSSTLVRDKVKNNLSINYIVEKNCATYIKEMNLYEF